MNNSFEELRTFVAVVRGRTISAAARELGVVKSAVSRRLSDLENRLGVRLINRTSRTLTLTDSGAELYERALRLMADLQDAEQAASQGAFNAIGTLRISVPVSFSAHCLAPVLHQFLTQNPQLDLEIDTTDRQVDLVREGYDLALRITKLKDSSLVARGIAPIHHALCASPAYISQHGAPRTLQDLAHHKLIAYTFTEPRDRWTFKNGEQISITPNVRISNGDSIREAIIGGYGIAYLPTFIIYDAVREGKLKILLPETLREPLGLSAVYPSSRHVATKVRRFVDFCVAQFGDRPFWDDIIIARP
ncbi:LysR family transcriptional regulator [Oxalobacteraceae bacterium OTU3CINTB1]|nr:LysR family transcriptional regulator [Oxalobacteraceae bacterium OTU3CINTB1]